PASVEAYRAGTDAVVVGDVDDVQVRATTTGAELPGDMRLSIVDPGRTTAPERQTPAIDTARLSSATTAGAATPAPVPAAPATPDPATTPDPGTVATAAAVTAPQPEIYSRAQWGADERMRDKGSLRYGTIKAGFVHHTVNANNYTAEQVPAILRGIYAYHTQSRGWSDVGYNFLVDRFGRIWEGRYGGVDRAVVGAHTLNYNEQSFAMSAIGNFETAQPSSAMLDAYGRLFAWKLGLHGVSATGSAVMNGKSFRAINGHRDAGSTACPGKYLYAKLATIRQLAGSYQGTAAPPAPPPPPAPPAPVTTTPLDTNISGTEWPDFVVRDTATQQAFVVRTGGQVGFAGAKRAGTGFAGMDLVVGARDLDGDGVPDVLARDKKSGKTGFYKGDGAGKVSAVVRTTKRFKHHDLLVAVGDFDGDGRNDLVGRKADTGKLQLFRGNGRGGFKKTRLLAKTWKYELTTGVGDFDGDGHVDLLVRNKRNKLRLVPGKGAAELGSPARIRGKWGRYDVIAGLGDMTNDGVPDILVRAKKSGVSFVHPGNGRGGLGYSFGGFKMFAGFRFLSAGGSLAGGGSDLLARNAKGHLVVFKNRGGRGIEAVVPTGSVLSDSGLVMNVGDWNRDGHNDVMTRSASTGDLYLRTGNGADGFAAPVLAGTGFGTVADLRAVGDVTGDGVPDLTGTPAGGAATVYPGNGAAGFGAAVAARSAGKVPPNLARSVDSGRYDWALPIGNVDGKARKDVLVRERSTGFLWLLPGIKGGFDTRRFVAAGFGGYDLAG
ncbi:MAG TPA: FG-GAP-like repeat-containing protein, partial [Yinghuangia sp.]|nr:FG-GAP-like repeat-containing protein [Yinghuangia sp.]